LVCQQFVEAVLFYFDPTLNQFTIFSEDEYLAGVFMKVDTDVIYGWSLLLPAVECRT
jgi:hypothetical protein